MSERVAAFAALLALSRAALASPSAREIMTANEEVRRIASVTAEATLTVTREGSAAWTKTFTWWRKLSADGVHYQTLTRFHTPAEVRGEGILFLEEEEGQSDVLLYLPAYKKVRRVESEQQSSSFMGSDLSYADITTPHVDEYLYKLLREEPCPAPFAGVACWVIDCTPASEAVKERTGYSRSTQWIRKDNRMAVRGESADLDGAPAKQMEWDRIEEVDSGRHKWMARSLRVTDLRRKRTTVLRFEDLKVGAEIADSTFTQQNLALDR
jgi:hypothetical protein